VSAAGEVLRLALPDRAPEAPLTPMYRERLGPAVVPLLEALWQESPDTEFRPEVEGWLARHYTPDSTVAAAFGWQRSAYA